MPRALAAVLILALAGPAFSQDDEVASPLESFSSKAADLRARFQALDAAPDRDPAAAGREQVRALAREAEALAEEGKAFGPEPSEEELALDDALAARARVVGEARGHLLVVSTGLRELESLRDFAEECSALRHRLDVINKSLPGLRERAGADFEKRLADHRRFLEGIWKKYSELALKTHEREVSFEAKSGTAARMRGMVNPLAEEIGRARDALAQLKAPARGLLSGDAVAEKIVGLASGLSAESLEARARTDMGELGPTFSFESRRNPFQVLQQDLLREGVPYTLQPLTPAAVDSAGKGVPPVALVPLGPEAGRKSLVAVQGLVKDEAGGVRAVRLRVLPSGEERTQSAEDFFQPGRSLLAPR